MTSEHANLREAAPRFLFPSVRDIVFIFLFCSVLAGTLSNRPLADPDIGWHIRTGEQILLTHTLPRTDPYSSLMHGQPWFAWEWLYDLALGILHHFCGLNGVVWLCALLVATTFTLLLSQLMTRGTGLLLAIVLMLLAEAAATVHLFARPHIASWLLVLLWFLALEQWQQGSVPPRLSWFFPVSMLLWVNVHGEFIVGLVLMAIYTFTALVESWRSQDPFKSVLTAQRARRMIWFGVLSALATFVNPYGWHLHQHIYRYLGDRYLMDCISEFLSPNFHFWAQRCFGFILVLTMVAWRGRSVSLCHLLVTLLAVYMALFSTRNLPVSSMLLVLLIGPALGQSVADVSETPGAWRWLRTRVARGLAFSERMREQEFQLRGHIWPVVCVIGALALCLHGGRLGSLQLVREHFDSKVIPVAATDFVERQPDREAVFTTDSWGGYLIYRLYPRRLVVVDDRHDLYGSGRVRQILVAMQGKPGWEKVLEDLQVRTVLLPADSTLVGLLRELPQDWQLQFEDKLAVVFERRVR